MNTLFRGPHLEAYGRSGPAARLQGFLAGPA